MTEPVMIEPMMMKSSGDCWAACLCMVLGKSYPQVMAAAPKRGKPTWNGLTPRQIVSLAKRLRVPLKFRCSPAMPEDDDLGILDLVRNDGSDEHVAVYIKGVVYEPADGCLYTDLAAYLFARNMKVTGFYWRA